MLKIRNFISRYETQVIITLILIFTELSFVVAAPGTFLKVDTYTSIFTVNAFLIILASSVVPVVIAGEIDLSFPSIMGFGALAFSKIYLLTMNPILGLFAALSCGFILGMINGLLISRTNVPSLILTLGTYFLWRGVIYEITGGIGNPLTTIMGHWFHKLFVGKIYFIPAQMFWAIIFSAFIWFMLNRTKFGANIYAVGDNRAAAKVMGVNVERTITYAYIVSGMGSAFVGVLSDLLQTTFWPTMGEGYLLATLAAIFVGGTPTWGGKGTIYGTVCGSLLLGIISTGIIAAGASGFWELIAYGLIIVIAICVYNIIRKKEAIARRLMV